MSHIPDPKLTPREADALLILANVTLSAGDGQDWDAVFEDGFEVQAALRGRDKLEDAAIAAARKAGETQGPTDVVLWARPDLRNARSGA